MKKDCKVCWWWSLSFIIKALKAIVLIILTNAVCIICGPKR